MSKSNDLISTVIRTLVGNGFTIEEAETRSTYFYCEVLRRELLDIDVGYLLFVSNGALSAADVESILKRSEHKHLPAVLISPVAPLVMAPFPRLTPDQFTERLGGEILSMLPLQPHYEQQLSELGFNALPVGLRGSADDLFEGYVFVGLQFILRRRVLRYGQERRFEVVPDGISYERTTPLILYDAKAAKDGYDVTVESARQFGDYVKKVNDAYASTLGRVFAFLVVSGEFRQGSRALEDRAREFRADYEANLCFLEAGEMAKVIALLKERPLLRRSIAWNRVLSYVEVTAAEVESNIGQLRRDRILE